MTRPLIYTSNDYMNDLCSYDEFYNQFITDEVINWLKIHMLNAIMSSKECAFGDIPQFLWEKAEATVCQACGKAVTQAGAVYTTALAVRIAKQAAHKMRAEVKWYHAN